MTTVVASLQAGQRSRAALWLLVLAGTLFTVAFEQGTVTGGQPLFHELFHDARHLLGFPCH
jgi:rhodanese-related sulfurtransferase